MTVRDMIMEFWDLSGHAPDLYPFQSDNQIQSEIDLNAEGTQYFLGLISKGQVALANWKKADQRFVRFRDFYISRNIQLGVDENIEYSIQRNSEFEFQVDPTQTDWVLDSDAMSNSVMVSGSSKYKIMSVTEVSPTVWTFYLYPEMSEPESVTYPYTIDEVQFALNEFAVSNTGISTDTWKLDLPERVYSILRIDDFQAGEDPELRQANNKEDLATAAEALNVGTPTAFANFGSKIVFDTALLEKRWYKFELFQQPAEITALDDVAAIPEPFHQALIFWGMWKIALRERQEIHATNYRRLLERELLSTRDEYDNDFERSKTNGFKVRRA